MPIRRRLAAVAVLVAAASWAPGLHAQAPAPAPAPPPKSSPAPKSAPVFPAGPAAKYAKEKPGTARMHTCLDQYHANKAANANGGMKWIQKGGGYYSVCLKQMKG